MLSRRLAWTACNHCTRSPAIQDNAATLDASTSRGNEDNGCGSAAGASMKICRTAAPSVAFGHAAVASTVAAIKRVSEACRFSWHATTSACCLSDSSRQLCKLSVSSMSTAEVYIAPVSSCWYCCASCVLRSTCVAKLAYARSDSSKRSRQPRRAPTASFSSSST